MRITAGIVLILFCYAANCQQAYFNNRYDFFNIYDGAGSILEEPNGYIVGGLAGDSTTGNWRVALMLIDTNGMVVWQKSYTEGNSEYGMGNGALIKTFDNGYAAGIGRMQGTNASNVGMLWKFDQNGDTIWTKWYGSVSNYFETFAQCKQTPDSGFILIGATDEPSGGGNTDIWLVKTDKNGTFEWDTTYGGSGVEYGFTVDITNDGGYILGGYTNSFGAGDQDTYIIKVDSIGNVQWDTTFGGILLDCGGSIKQTVDNGYIISTCIGKFFLSGSYLQRQARIIKLDSAGNIEWDKSYGPARLALGLFAIHELADGSFVAAGQRANRAGTPNGNGWAEGVVLKVSSNGDSLWYRIYEYNGCEKNFDYIRDIKPTNDGGFIVSGFFTPRTATPCFDTGTQDIWVMKLDSCGCVFAGCDSACAGLVGVEEFSVSGLEFRVYPNPFSRSSTIVIPNEVRNLHSSALHIFDVIGRKLKTYSLKKGQSTLTIYADEIGIGIFFIQLISDGPLVATEKIVIIE